MTAAPDQTETLRRASELADAQLEVAEVFAWPMAGLSAALAYVTLHHWAWAVVAYVGGFVVSVYSMRKASDNAEDAYFKAAKLGNYVQLGQDDSQDSPNAN